MASMAKTQARQRRENLKYVKDNASSNLPESMYKSKFVYSVCYLVHVVSIYRHQGVFHLLLRLAYLPTNY